MNSTQSGHEHKQIKKNFNLKLTSLQQLKNELKIKNEKM